MMMKMKMKMMKKTTRAEISSRARQVRRFKSSVDFLFHSAAIQQGDNNSWRNNMIPDGAWCPAERGEEE